MARCGWGIIITNCDGVHVGKGLGHLPGPSQDNYKAEVFAVCMGLVAVDKHALAGSTILLVTIRKGVMMVWHRSVVPH